MQTGDSLVIQSRDGINVVTERNLAAEKEADKLGLSATLHIQAETGAVQLTLSALPDVQLPQSLELRMRHPTMASRDAGIELLRAMPGADGQAMWAGHFTTPPRDRLYVTLSSGDSWRLTGEWNGESAIELGQSGRSGDVTN
jgi:hypothetical protein